MTALYPFFQFKAEGTLAAFVMPLVVDMYHDLGDLMRNLTIRFS